MTDLYPADLHRDAEDVLSRVREAMPTPDDERPVELDDEDRRDES